MRTADRTAAMTVPRTKRAAAAVEGWRASQPSHFATAGIERLDSMDDDRRAFLIQVACLHHEYHLHQEAIAERLGVSRSTISRALSEAEQLGLVQVTITEPLPKEARLGETLRERYGITAHVAMRLTDEAGAQAAARVGARLIERTAAPGDVTIAASWGRTLARAARAVRPRRASGVTVVDTIGHAIGEDMAPAVAVTRTLASAFGGDAIHVPSPAFADSGASLAFLLGSAPVAHVLDLARQASLTLVSLGVAGRDSLLLHAGLVSPAVMDGMVRAGAVGEMLGHYFRADGSVIRRPSLFPVGLSLDDLQAARRVVVVAGGREKATAMRAAIDGRFLKEIVVDDELADALVAMER